MKKAKEDVCEVVFSFYSLYDDHIKNLFDEGLHVKAE